MLDVHNSLVDFHSLLNSGDRLMLREVECQSSWKRFAQQLDNKILRITYMLL